MISICKTGLPNGRYCNVNCYLILPECFHFVNNPPLVSRPLGELLFMNAATTGIWKVKWGVIEALTLAAVKCLQISGASLLIWLTTNQIRRIAWSHHRHQTQLLIGCNTLLGLTLKGHRFFFLTMAAMYSKELYLDLWLRLYMSCPCKQFLSGKNNS